jgi:N-acetyl-gamma-glutamylphosphate reductase
LTLQERRAKPHCRTGVTGYIAGDALYALHYAHPDYEYAALVRTREKGNIVQKAYPNVRVVLGGLDDAEILKTEAAKADIVLREHYHHLPG